jgi:hypothetical protein
MGIMAFWNKKKIRAIHDALNSHIWVRTPDKGLIDLKDTLPHFNRYICTECGKVERRYITGMVIEVK